MGGLQLIKNQEYIPYYFTSGQTKELVADTNKRLKQHRFELKLILELNSAELKYLEHDWKRSKITGSVCNYERKGGSRQEVVRQPITIQLQQIYRINNLLKHLHKETREEEMTPTPNPGANEDEDKQCCICYAQKVSTVLPCTHSYCAKCTTLYIIEKEEHRCPECRTEFMGNKQQIKKQFYEVIEQQKVFYEQARSIILNLLSKRNGQVINKLKQEYSPSRNR